MMALFSCHPQDRTQPCSPISSQGLPDSRHQHHSHVSHGHRRRQPPWSEVICADSTRKDAISLMSCGEQVGSDPHNWVSDK